MRFVRNAVFACCALLATAGMAQEHAWPTAGWQVAAPESQGLDARALAALVDHGAQSHLDSLLVARNGRLVLEAYYAPFGPDHLHTINSATKGVVAALVGIAVQQGLLPGGDARVADVYPPFAGDGSDARRAAVTVQHLLDMTSGIAWKEPLSGVPESAMQMGASPDWARFVAERPMARAPGTAFDYNSGNSQLLLAILAHRAGMNAEAFARQHLFEPLGIRDWRWTKDPTGAPAGGFGLKLRPRDMAKIGLLFLQRGEWEGRQLVPRAWMEKVFQASVPMGDDPGPAFRYGDGFWTLPARKAYMAVGFHGQVIMVLPESGLVVVTTARRGVAFDQLLDRVQAAVRSASALPADPAAAEVLAASLRAAAVEPPQAASAVPAPAFAPQVSGRTWKLGPNPLGLKEFTLHLDGPQARLEQVSYVRRNSPETRSAVQPLRLDGSGVPGDSSRGPAITRAGWLEDGRLWIRTRYIEEGETASYVMRFEGRKLTGEYAYTTGMRTNFTAEAQD
jgi:CubicO group peptidase (beta-lactamase class C family)